MILYPELQPRSENYDQSQAARNIERASNLGIRPSIEPEDISPLVDNDSTIAIIGNGPSIKKIGLGEKQTGIEQINSGQDKNGQPMHLVAASGGWRLVESGDIKAVAAFVVHLAGNDPVGVVANPMDGVVYHIGAPCFAPGTPDKPAIEEHLKGHDIQIWYPYLDGITPPDQNQVQIGAGSGAPIAAIALYAAMGYRKFEIFGMGGGFDHAAEYDANHRYPQGMSKDEYLNLIKTDQVGIRIDGKIYHLPAFVWAQAEEIMELKELEPDIQVHFHGDPLFMTIFNTPDGNPRRNFEILRPQQPPAAALEGPGF